jgi:WD40 repeat protein
MSLSTTSAPNQPNKRKSRRIVGTIVSFLIFFYFSTLISWFNPVDWVMGNQVFFSHFPYFQAYERFEGASLSPDGLLLAGGGNTHIKNNSQAKVIIWDVKSGKRLWEVVLPFPPEETYDQITELTWSPDSSYLVAGDNKGSIFVFNGADGTILNTVSFGTYEPCLLAFTADGNLLGINKSPSADGKNLVLWSWPDLKELWRDSVSCQDADLSLDGKTVILSNWSQRDATGIGLIDLETKNTQENLFVRSSGTSRSDAITISPDKSQIAVGYHDGSMIIWDAKTYTPITEEKLGQDLVRSIAWKPDGTTIASSTFENLNINVYFKLHTIRLINLVSKKVSRIWTVDKVASQVEFTQDNQHLIYVVDGKIVLYKLR